MKAYLVTFWSLVISLAGIVGLYVGAVAIQKVLYFWIVIGAALMFAAAKPGLKITTDLAIRFRNYPGLLTRVAAADDEIALLKSQLDEAKDRVIEARQLGLAEGRDGIVGSILSIGLSEIPAVSGIADDAGTVALVGRYSIDAQPRIKTRFYVVSQGTGEIKGAVEVSRVDDEKKLCLLRCDAGSAEKFWERLGERVSYDEAAPSNVVLERYVTKDNDIMNVFGDYSITGAAEVAE